MGNQPFLFDDDRPKPNKDSDETVWHIHLRAAEKRLMALWNALPETHRLAVAVWNEKRHDMFKARMKDPDWWGLAMKALELIPENNFFAGENPRGWKANIIWFLRPDSVARVLEGFYGRDTEDDDADWQRRIDDAGEHRSGG